MLPFRTEKDEYDIYTSGTMGDLVEWFKVREKRPVPVMVIIIWLFFIVSLISIFFNGFDIVTGVCLGLSVFTTFLFVPFILITFLKNAELEFIKYRDGKMKRSEMGFIARSGWILRIYYLLRRIWYIVTIILLLLLVVIHWSFLFLDIEAYLIAINFGMSIIFLIYIISLFSIYTRVIDHDRYTKKRKNPQKRLLLLCGQCNKWVEFDPDDEKERGSCRTCGKEHPLPVVKFSPEPSKTYNYLLCGKCESGLFMKRPVPETIICICGTEYYF
jgi:hypothetical protein